MNNIIFPIALKNIANSNENSICFNCEHLKLNVDDVSFYDFDDRRGPYYILHCEHEEVCNDFRRKD